MPDNLTSQSVAGAILGIETSCDETAAAVVSNGKEVLSSVVSSQVDLHSDYGGVVPEIASRAHLELLLPVVESAIQKSSLNGAEPFSKLSAVAATNGPGLIGALLVGVSAAKSLAMAWELPFVAVNHLEAHLYSAFIDESEIQFPLVVLLVSGGHTMLILMTDHGEYEVMGRTLDDAAGEAFDKTARVLGLGYPGGQIIDELAEKGNPEAITFPRPMLKAKNLDFSFSGLKTAVVNHLMKESAKEDFYLEKLQAENSQSLADIAASFQASVADVLVAKTISAVKQSGAGAICVAGGVSANSELRRRISSSADKLGVSCYLASREMCTDNAAMVAAAGWWQINRQGPSELSTSVNPSTTLNAL